MNVHVRLFAASALASLAALALTGTPLAAQSAQSGSDAGASAIAAVSVAPTAFVAPLGSVSHDSASATTTPGLASGRRSAAPARRAHASPLTPSARQVARPQFFQDKKPKRSVVFMIVGGAALIVGRGDSVTTPVRS
jgi:hypothetical protein